MSSLLSRLVGCSAAGLLGAGCALLRHDDAHRGRPSLRGELLLGPACISCTTFRFVSFSKFVKLQGWFDDAQLSSILRDGVDAFEAGAPFPDWGYRCAFMHRSCHHHLHLVLIGRKMAAHLPFPAAPTMATTSRTRARLPTGVFFSTTSPSTFSTRMELPTSGSSRHKRALLRLFCSV